MRDDDQSWFWTDEWQVGEAEAQRECCSEVGILRKRVQSLEDEKRMLEEMINWERSQRWHAPWRPWWGSTTTARPSTLGYGSSSRDVTITADEHGRITMLEGAR